MICFLVAEKRPCLAHTCQVGCDLKEWEQLVWADSQLESGSSSNQSQRLFPFSAKAGGETMKTIIYVLSASNPDLRERAESAERVFYDMCETCQHAPTDTASREIRIWFNVTLRWEQKQKTKSYLILLFSIISARLQSCGLIDSLKRQSACFITAGLCIYHQDYSVCEHIHMHHL